MRPTPKTTLYKKSLHTLYLVQPVLQFLALIAVITILSRCSPLASSTNKDDSMKPSVQSSQAQATDNQNINKVIADENPINKNDIKDLGTVNTEVEADNDFASHTQPSIQSDSALSTAMISERFAKKDGLSSLFSKSSPLVTIHLSKDQLETLVRDGSLRVDLAQHFAARDKDAQKALFAGLKKNLNSLNFDASSYLVLPAAAMNPEYSELKMPIDVALSITGEASGVLELQYNNDSENAENASLLESAIRDAKQLAIVLE